MRSKIQKFTTLLWLAFFASGTLLVGSIAVLADQNQKQAKFTHGWELATRQEEMPWRSPIAGINVELTQYSPTELAEQLDKIAALGVTWLRQPFYWERIEPERGEYDWSAYDAIVAAIRQHPSLKIIAVLDGTPRWARYELSPDHPFSPPASASEFAQFARRFAQHYANRINIYQIWDEPNLRSHWGNIDPQPALYIAMLKTSYTAIHTADETATVIMAALAPTVELGPANYNDIQFLRAVYEQGGGDYFDAVAAKPYGYDFDPYNRKVSNRTFNFSRLITWREEMVKHGDGDKAIWGSNFGWNHLPDGWNGPPSIWGQVSAEQQIAYTRQAFQRAEQEWPWLGGLILQHWQPDAPLDDPIQGFAVAPHFDQWTADGPLATIPTALLPGLYPMQNEFTEFEGQWQLGPLGADSFPVNAADPAATAIENTVSITFYGTEFALLVRRYGVITAYYDVSIDGQPANALPLNRQGEAQLVLKSAESGESLDLILAASGLDPGTHVAKIIHRPRQGDDAWGLAGIAVGIAPDTSRYERIRLAAYLAGAAGLLGLLATIYTLPWQQVKLPSQKSMTRLGEVGLTLFLSTVFVLGSALSWGDSFTTFLKRDPPAFALTLATVGVAFLSPMVIITLLALMAFAVVVFNRPIMGLLAVIFWSMFFTSKVTIYFRDMTVVEAMLLISTIAIFGRGLYESIRIQRESAVPYELNQVWQAAQQGIFRLTALDQAMIAFVALAIVSILWATLLPQATHELRVIILGPAVFYVLLRNARLDKSDLISLADVVIVGGTVIALIGLRNYLSGTVIETAEGSKRLIAVYGSPNSVALQLGRCLPFALAYAWLPVGNLRRTFGVISGALMLVAFLLTQSLGGIILGLPAAVIVMFLGWRDKQFWRWLLGLMALGTLVFIALMRLVPRLRNLTNPDSNTTLFRVNIWRSTVELLKDHPITGVGLDQFLYAYRSRYILPEGSADPNLSHPHNIFLDYWVRLGIFGVVVGLWMQIAFWRTILAAVAKLRDGDVLLFAVALGTMGLMADFLAHGLVDTAFFTINLSFLFVLALALAHQTLHLASSSVSEENR